MPVFLNTHFKSRKDTFLLILLYILIIPISGISVVSIIEENGAGNFWGHFIVFFTLGFILWFLHGTKYILTDHFLEYHSGPIRGKIELVRIREIVVGKTMYVGLKAALARKGLIIKYDKYNDIYISPKSNERFIREILKRNDSIKITRISSSR